MSVLLAALAVRAGCTKEGGAAPHHFHRPCRCLCVAPARGSHEQCPVHSARAICCRSQAAGTMATVSCDVLVVGGGCCEPRATTVSAVRGKRCFVRLSRFLRFLRFSLFPEISHKMFAASTAFREMHFTTPLFRLNIGRNNCAHLQSGTIPDSVGCGQPNGTIAMYGKDLLTPHMSLLCMRLIDRVGVSTMESGVGLMP